MKVIQSEQNGVDFLTLKFFFFVKWHGIRKSRIFHYLFFREIDYEWMNNRNSVKSTCSIYTINSISQNIIFNVWRTEKANFILLCIIKKLTSNSKDLIEYCVLSKKPNSLPVIINLRFNFWSNLYTLHTHFSN